MSIQYENKVDRLCLWHKSTTGIPLSFPPHFHDSLEIAYLLSGKATACIDGQTYDLQAGDMTVAMPNAIHSYFNESGVNAHLLIVPRRYTDAYEAILHENTVATAKISAERSADLRRLIEQIYTVNQSDHPFRKQLIAGYFTLFFGEVFRLTGLMPCKKTPPETERRIITYCLENFRRDISLKTMESELNISKTHISYIFSSKLKISLPDFVGSLRVKEAKRLIEGGMNMTDAAFESGFSSIRTFNRRFLYETGMTPREYAAQIKNR